MTISVVGRVEGWPGGGDGGGIKGGGGGKACHEGGGIGERRVPSVGGDDPKCSWQTDGTKVSRPVEHERPEVLLEVDGGRRRFWLTRQRGAALRVALEHVGERPCLHSRAQCPVPLQWRHLDGKRHSAVTWFAAMQLKQRPTKVADTGLEHTGGRRRQRRWLWTRKNPSASTGVWARGTWWHGGSW